MNNGDCFVAAIAPAFGANLNPHTCGCGGVGGGSGNGSSNVADLVFIGLLAGLVMGWFFNNNKGDAQ